MIRRFCSWLARRMPAYQIDRSGGKYLTRYYLVGRRRGASREWPVNLYLHQFHADDEKHLHNHPWAWAVSLMLAGGYNEERRGPGDRLVSRLVRPFQVNMIRGDDFHRVELVTEDAWTLFLAGPRRQSWGFWDPVTGDTIDWRDDPTARANDERRDETVRER